jgi:hypothetical protein
MNLPVMLIMVGIFQILSVFWEHKRPRSVTEFKISWSIITQIFLSVLALSEYLTFCTFYTSYLLAFALLMAMLNFIGHFIKYSCFLWKSKFHPHFNKNHADVIFYLNLRIRQLCSVDKISQTFFYKNDGLTIFFGDPDKHFSVLSETLLQLFKNNLTACTMANIDFGSFVIVKDKENYISLSSDELKTLDIPLTGIDRNYLALIEMSRI